MIYGSIYYPGTPPHAAPEHAHAKSTVIFGCAFVELAKVNGMLESTVFHQTPLRYLGIVPCQAHGKPEEGLGVRVEALGAEFDDVSETWARSC